MTANLELHDTRSASDGAHPILRVHAVSKRFGGLLAVDKASLTVRPEEVFSLIGPNGAGKSTLFSIISGFVRPDEGQVFLGAQDVSPLSAHERCRLGLGRTFQNIRLVDGMSVMETVMVGRYSRTRAGLFHALWPTSLDRTERRETLERSEDLLVAVGLWDKRHLGARNLSYGDQRRLEVARALAGEPKILLLDEPTAGMNDREVADVMEFITRLRSRGQTILLIEHNMRLVTEISDRVAVLDSGSIIAEGTPQEIQQHPAVIRAYLGTEEDHD